MLACMMSENLEARSALVIPSSGDAWTVLFVFSVALSPGAVIHADKLALLSPSLIVDAICAEDGGFEPPRAFTQPAFQACAIGH